MDFFRWLRFNLAYYRNPRWDTGISPPELLDFIASHPTGKALDIGCGSGTNAITLAQHGWQVVGVDFAATAISIARAKTRKAKVNATFLVGNASRLANIGEPFDLLLDIGCFHNLSDDERARYIRNFDTLMAEGGFFLLYTFFKDPLHAKHGITERDLERLSERLCLVWRQDGLDRNGRNSVWLCWEKPQ